MVYIGTGRLFSTIDGLDKSTQAVYGIWDNEAVDGTPVDIVALRKQTLTSVVHASGAAVRVASTNVPDWSVHRGWTTPTEIVGASPLDQGERHQLLDADGKPIITRSTEGHTRAGVGAILVGRNTATYRIWDGMRAIDYLASRPEVDADRIGCTGISGGGTMTSYLMALDDRIQAAAPGCFITTTRRKNESPGPGDAEQNIFGQIAYGMDHADYILMRAPKPTLICAATHDFVPIEGTWEAFREAKRLYTRRRH